MDQLGADQCSDNSRSGVESKNETFAFRIADPLSYWPIQYKMGIVVVYVARQFGFRTQSVDEPTDVVHPSRDPN